MPADIHHTAPASHQQSLAVRNGDFETHTYRIPQLCTYDCMNTLKASSPVPCRTEVEAGKFYTLGACSHVYCTDCLGNYLKSATGSNSFPIHCHSTAGSVTCGKPVCLADLRKVLSAVELSAGYKAMTRAYLNTHSDSWGCCPTPDCPQVRVCQPSQRLACTWAVLYYMVCYAMNCTPAIRWTPTL
jgi:hypothetical protein